MAIKSIEFPSKEQVTNFYKDVLNATFKQDIENTQKANKTDKTSDYAKIERAETTFDQIKIEKEREKLESLRQDRVQRRAQADNVLSYVREWSIALFLILIGCGIGWFKLPENVLMILVGGSTIQVLGLFAIVLNYLFPKKVKYLNKAEKTDKK